MAKDSSLDPSQDQPKRYVRRLVEHRLADYLEGLPGILVVGPRAVGKTTTASRYARTIVRLDRAIEAEPFLVDPDAALAGLEEPVLIDEWQLAPDVLGAIKRSIDLDSHPGRFIVTGSVRADMSSPTWPGTGRLVRIPMLGMTVREQASRARHESLVSKLITHGAEVEVEIRDAPDIRGYLDLAMLSGFPEPSLELAEERRGAWFQGYIDQIVTRDAELVSTHRDPDRVRRFLNAYAATTAQVVEDKTLCDAVGITYRTMVAYEQLLINLFALVRVPAWAENRLKRLTRSPKRYVADPAIAAVLAGVSTKSLMRDGAMLGPIIETFVVAQLRAELAAAEPPLSMYHLRVASGRHEVDVVVEVDRDTVIAFEIKASAAVGRDGARHLIWLRDQLGKRFKVGVVFHTGPRPYRLDESIVALPVAALWG